MYGSEFLDEDLFTGEVQPDWEGHLEAVLAESPFESGFGGDFATEEQEQPDEEDYLFEAEWSAWESETPLDDLAPSELKAVRITSTFETGRPGSFGGLTGNFDGQGVSFGLMNFAWKAGSLVALLVEFLRNHPEDFVAVFGPDAGQMREILLASKPDPKNPKRQVRDVDRQMDFARNVLNDAKNKISEPWRTYFGRLETNPAFRRIQVKAARKAADRARYWCEYFGLKTERAFAFMFDLVSSHGGSWLNAPKFKGQRRKVLRSMLAKKKEQVGRSELSELEKLEVIANMIANASSSRWRERVRVRKLWFVTGTGKVHGRFWDLAKDFGVSDAPPDFGTGRSLELEAELFDLLDESTLEEMEEFLERYNESQYELSSEEFLLETWEAEDDGLWDELDEPWLEEETETAEESSEEEEEQFDVDEFDELEGGPKQLYGDELFVAELPANAEMEEGEVTAELDEQDAELENILAMGDEQFLAEETGIDAEGNEFEPSQEAFTYHESELFWEEEPYTEMREALALEEQELDQQLGKTFYLPIRLNQTTQPKVGVFIPSGYKSSTTIDLIVYFHGKIDACPETKKGNFTRDGIEGYWNTNSLRNLRTDLAASGCQAILIAPTLAPHPGIWKVSKLHENGKFDFLINETISQLTNQGAFPKGAQVRNIILSGHSAGGRPMLEVLSAKNTLRKNIVEAWGFECLYFGTSDWESWLKANPQYFFIHFRQKSFKQAETDRLKKFSNFKDVPNARGHCKIIYEKWREALDSSPALGGGRKAPITTKATLLTLLNGLSSLAQLPFTFMAALLKGVQDENQLTNLIFFARHPELGGRKLTSSDPQLLKDEWVQIRQTIVRPALSRLKEAKSKPQRSSSTPPGLADTKFPLFELTLERKKIVVASTRDKKKGTTVSIEEAPADFLPEIIRMARDLARKDGKSDLANRLDPATWFKQFTRVTFLGRSLHTGQYVHLEMAKLLKTIEAEMVRKHGGDAKSVGDILLKGSDEGIAGSRLVSSTAVVSMHLFGLAVDVNYLGNPYIQKHAVGALNRILSSAAGLMNRAALAYKNGLNFDQVQELDSLLEKYFALLDSSAELERLVQGSLSSNWRGLSSTSAREKIQKDLDTLAPLLARGSKRKDYFKRHAILNFDKRFVEQMQALGLHWGGEYGDMMHFDMRRSGVGFYIQKARMSYLEKVRKEAVARASKGGSSS